MHRPVAVDLNVSSLIILSTTMVHRLHDTIGTVAAGQGYAYCVPKKWPPKYV